MDVFEDIEGVMSSSQPPKLLSNDSISVAASQPVCFKCVEQHVPPEEPVSPLFDRQSFLDELDLPDFMVNFMSSDKHESILVYEAGPIDKQPMTPASPVASQPVEGLTNWEDNIEYRALDNDFPPAEASLLDWSNIGQDSMDFVLDNPYPLEIGEEDLHGSYYNTPRSCARRNKRKITLSDNDSLHAWPKRLRIDVC